MEIKQIASIINTIQQEVLGDSAIVTEDLSQIVDIGRKLFDAASYDKVTGKLVDHVGRVVFASRPYTGRLLSVYRDGWEYGGALEKVRTVITPASENESWQLQDGQVYETNKYVQPKVEARYYNMRTTLEYRQSIADRQLKSAFSSAEQLNGLLAMLDMGVRNSMTLGTEALVKRAVNNMCAAAIHSASPLRAINLLAVYNTTTGSTLTAAAALRDRDFLRFAATEIDRKRRQMADFTALYNAAGAQTHTPLELQHVVMHDSLVYAIDNYLRADTYHDKLLANPYGEIVTHWQGTGTSYSWQDSTAIDVLANIPDEASPVAVKQSGIVAAIWDHEAIAVTNEEQRVTSHHVDSADFTNFWYKRDAGYLNAFDENFIVFYIADQSAT